MLLFPAATTSNSLIGAVSAAIRSATGNGGSSRKVPAATLPVVFFVWGPGRIVPVRVADLSITEKLYDPLLLNPTYVEAQLRLKVLTREELKYVPGKLGSVATAAYVYSQSLRQAQSLDNLVNDAAAVIGMLPL